jgi:splicing factor 1
MWRPATKQITGTNDGKCLGILSFTSTDRTTVPLGQRRRFGPAPTEDAAPPQLAQPSPSVYPRQRDQDTESPGKREREESPSTGDPKGKLRGRLTHSHFYWQPLVVRAVRVHAVTAP